jgi:hypothetical protein
VSVLWAAVSPARRWVVEESADLVAWSVVIEHYEPLTALQFFDYRAAGSAFYRLREVLP